MTIEEKLKDYILTQYKSIRDFAQKADMPYTTVDGILKRGVAGASIGNVIKLCSALNICADELAKGNIVPDSKSHNHVLFSEISENITQMDKYRENYNDLTVDGVNLSIDEYELFLHANLIAVELIRKGRSIDK